MIWRFLLGIVGIIGLMQPAQANDFRESSFGLQWQHRLVVVFDDGAMFQAQKDELTEAAFEWLDRDLVLIGVSGASVHTIDHQGQLSAAQIAAIKTLDVKTLRDRYPGPVILIGKDGGVKLRQDHPITNADLFSTIDVMPMRRREMSSTP